MLLWCTPAPPLTWVQVLPGDIMLLAEPAPEALAEALEEALGRVGGVDPAAQHAQVGGRLGVGVGVGVDGGGGGDVCVHVFMWVGGAGAGWVGGWVGCECVLCGRGEDAGMGRASGCCLWLMCGPLNQLGMQPM